MERRLVLQSQKWGDVRTWTARALYTKSLALSHGGVEFLHHLGLAPSATKISSLLKAKAAAVDEELGRKLQESADGLRIPIPVLDNYFRGEPTITSPYDVYNRADYTSEWDAPSATCVAPPARVTI
jgi:hypothetical protein